jgi:hypothetical protein
MYNAFGPNTTFGHAEYYPALGQCQQELHRLRKALNNPSMKAVVGSKRTGAAAEPPAPGMLVGKAAARTRQQSQSLDGALQPGVCSLVPGSCPSVRARRRRSASVPAT